MSGDTLDFLQGTRETLTGTLHDPAATTGHVLTVQADKSIAAAPGGGGSTPLQGEYTFAEALADGAGVQLTWVYDSGDAILDLTDPINPTAPAGVYAISGYMEPNPIDGTIDWTYVLQVGLDFAGAAPYTQVNRAVPGNTGSPVEPLTVVGINPANGIFFALAQVINAGHGGNIIGQFYVVKIA